VLYPGLVWPERRQEMRSVGQVDGYRGRTASKGRRRGRIIRRKEMPLWQELPLLLVVAFCLAVLIRTFLVQAFYIPSGSMEHTLEIKDRVLVNKVVYDMRDPLRGEIVVFRGTDNWAPEVTEPVSQTFAAKLGRTIGDLVGVSRPGERDFIKRVIGLPGDKVACCDAKGRITVNGIAIDEPYVTENSPLDSPPNPTQCTSRRFAEVTVPAGDMFVMGDHRLVSQDARCQGPVPITNIIGRAFVVVWPSDHFTGLSIPDNWKAYGAEHPAALGPQPVRAPDPGADVIIGPFLLSAGLSARSGLTFRSPRRRLRS
jgi:signal peptidase I